MVNFGIDYGMTPYGLSERLGISVHEAKVYIQKYLTLYAGVRQYIEETKKHVDEHGWVVTLSGRRRYIPMVADGRKQVKEAAYRQAINMPIQGTAADIIKIAMINIHAEFKDKQIESKMVLQVHDELLFDVIPDEHDTVAEIVKRQMEGAWVLKVPLKVDLNSGPNWAKIH